MNFYVILTILMVILLMRHGRYSRKIGVFISFVLWFLAAFRGEKVGHDTISYIEIEYIRQSANISLSSLSDFTDFDNSIEFISNFINKLVLILNLNGQWVLIFYAMIMIVFMYKSCERLNVSTTYVMCFFVVLGYYFYSLSACRQICAVSVIMYAMTFLKDKGIIKYSFFVWLVVAMMIHATSFICVPLFFLYKLPNRLSYKKIGWCIFLISIISTLLRIDFLNQMSILASSEHFSNYLDGYGETSYSISSIIACWIETSCLFYFFLTYKKYDCNKGMNILDYLFLLSFFVSAALIQYDGLVARVKYNIVIMQCFYLALLFERKCIWSPTFSSVASIFMLLRIVKNYSFEIALESNYYFCF